MLLFLLLLIAMPFGAAYASDVDAAIVFAIDASASIDPMMAKLQRDGHASALSEPIVIAAISSGLNGCIAVAYIEWASPGQARTVLPWSRICTLEDALIAAHVIRSKGSDGEDCQSYCATSISDAIDVSMGLLDAYQGGAVSKIIDISASGTNNDGPPLELSRRRALRRGYIINAVVIPRVRSGAIRHLLDYFTRNVIGGAGSFAIESSGAPDYANALRRKFLHEISGASGPRDRYETAATSSPDREYPPSQKAAPLIRQEGEHADR